MPGQLLFTVFDIIWLVSRCFGPDIYKTIVNYRGITFTARHLHLRLLILP